MKESGLPNWAKTPDSKDPKQPGTTAIIEEESSPVKKEPFSKRRDSSESANGKRKNSAETKQKVEAKTPQTPVKASGTPKKTPTKEKTLEKSPLKSPPSPSKVPTAPGSPAKQRRSNLVRSESAQVVFKHSFF